MAKKKKLKRKLGVGQTDMNLSLYKAMGKWIEEDPNRTIMDAVYEFAGFLNEIKMWAIQTGHVPHYNAHWYCGTMGLPKPVLTPELVAAMTEGYTKNKH